MFDYLSYCLHNIPLVKNETILTFDELKAKLKLRQSNIEIDIMNYGECFANSISNLEMLINDRLDKDTFACQLRVFKRVFNQLLNAKDKERWTCFRICHNLNKRLWEQV